MTPAGDNLAAHLRDARFHLANAARSIDRARDHARRQASDRELAQLDRFARLARGLLYRIGRRELGRVRWSR
jgi:hypothetical protein